VPPGYRELACAPDAIATLPRPCAFAATAHHVVLLHRFAATVIQGIVASLRSADSTSSALASDDALVLLQGASVVPAKALRRRLGGVRHAGKRRFLQSRLLGQRDRAITPRRRDPLAEPLPRDPQRARRRGAATSVGVERAAESSHGQCGMAWMISVSTSSVHYHMASPESDGDALGCGAA